MKYMYQVRCSFAVPVIDIFISEIFQLVLMNTPSPPPLPLLHCNNKRLEWVLIIRLKVCEFRVLNLNHYIAVPNPD